MPMISLYTEQIIKEHCICSSRDGNEHIILRGLRALHSLKALQRTLDIISKNQMKKEYLFIEAINELEMPIPSQIILNNKS